MTPERRLFPVGSPRDGSTSRILFADRDRLEEERFGEGGSQIGHAASRRAEETAFRRFQAAQWMQEMLGNLGISSEPTEEELRLCLRNGLVLCNLLNRIQPGAVSKIVENSPAEGPFDCFENVRSFLTAVKDMSLQSFQASDLSQGSGSMPKVADCILALKSYYSWKEGKTASPFKPSVRSTPEKSMEFMNTPKSHARRRWIIPETTDITDVSLTYELDSPNGFQRSPGNPYAAHEDTENYASYLTSPDSTSAHIHQIGQRFREVLQVRQETQQSDLSSADNAVANLKGASAQSLPNLVKSLICDKKLEEVPALVEYIVTRIVEEFQWRSRKQVSKHRSSLKQLAARAKVLEAIAAGSSEEIKIAHEQLHQSKTEKQILGDEMTVKDEDLRRLLQLKDEQNQTINTLKDELLSMKEQQQIYLDRQKLNEQMLSDYDVKFKALELKHQDSLSCIETLKASAAAESDRWKRREEVCKTIIVRQAETLQDAKLSAQDVKADILTMQLSWRENFSKLEQELGELTTAAQSYYDVLAENRRLYNEVQDLKGNIRVYCRVRPFLHSQKERNTTIEYLGENGEIIITNPTKHGKDASKMFNFNKIYGPDASQEQVFLDTEPLIRSVLDGYNVCIFAYGQTGSGKTYTMSGPENNWGVNNRALYGLFEVCQSRRDSFSYDVGVQMIEIYNEQVRDLLAADGVSKRLGIRTSTSHNGLNVPDALMIPVTSTEDVLEIMAIGQRNRAVGATALNERSSRSHSVLTVHVQGTDLHKGAILRGCLHLVDLAGSERVEKSEATGDRLKEAQHINKSLSALGDVIAALAQKSSHVPYRNSKLTQLLQDSLGGRAKTLMFVHVNPDVESHGETVSTLKFAERVSSVELGAARSNRESGELRDTKEQVALLKDLLAKKDAEIERLHNTKIFRGDTERPISRTASRLSIDHRGRRLMETSLNEPPKAQHPSQAAGVAQPSTPAPMRSSKRPESPSI